ncbi:MAG: hypothetical protein E4H14_09280 [Candidatus Thorarchaeota archaeon]|nr:MAG: hypothetical protein E4H14_09280 [Candidatus Thorarchaeota archaeon]
MLRRRILSIAFLSLLILSGLSSFIGTGIIPTSAETTGGSPTDLSGITVGIYAGYFSSIDPRVNESRTALYNMFTWMNASVFVFNTTELLNGCLWACEILAIPEGLGPTMENRLTNDGLQAIREWVALGGSYIGVRGSAAIAMNGSYFEGYTTTFDLALVNGTSYEVTDLEDRQMTNVSINRDSTGPDLSDMPVNQSVLFVTGRYFVPDSGQDVIYIANYTHSNLPAMIAGGFGQGNYFVSSPHFEYEENGDRDGTDYMDEYDDPDSEWPMLLTISRWLVDSSPTVANISSWPYTPPAPLPMDLILISAGVGAVLILVAVVVVKRR